MNHPISASLATLVIPCIITGSAAIAPAQELPRTPAPASYTQTLSGFVSAEDTQLTVIQESRQKNRFLFWAGVGIPTGDFGNSTTGKAGCANPGFTMGLGYTVGLTHEFGWTTYIDFVVNSMDGFRGTGNEGSTPLNSTGTWLTVWPMTGLEVAGNIRRDVRLYFDLLFGMVIGDMPQGEFSNQNGHTTFNGHAATAFSYGFAGGIVIADKYLLRASYTIATLDYDVDIAVTDVPQQTIQYQQPTSILRFAVGIEI